MTQEAAEQAREAKAWWRANRRAAPGLLREELAQAFTLLRTAPEIGTLYPMDDVPGLRRWQLPRTRYHVYYAYDGRTGILLVLAIWSMLRGQAPPMRLG